MPRYFFDYFENGEIFTDVTGVELSGLEEAAREAVTIAVEVARDHLTDHPDSGYVEVRVRNEAGETVATKSVGVALDGASVPPRP
jgi:hypothetical protein